MRTYRLNRSRRTTLDALVGCIGSLIHKRRSHDIQLPRSPGHVFYQKLNWLLAEAGFDPGSKSSVSRTMPKTAAGTLPIGGGHGLAGMRSRVDVFGGQLVTGPSAGGKFQVLASIPEESAP